MNTEVNKPNTTTTTSVDNDDLNLINCCWCGCLSFPAFKDKTYCSPCQLKCYRECQRCKRPFPNQSYFVHDETFCNSCFTQRIQQKSQYFKRKEMTKCVLKHFQDLEQVHPDSLLQIILNNDNNTTTPPPVKQPRRRRTRRNNVHV